MMSNKRVTKTQRHKVTSKYWGTGALQHWSTGRYVCLCLLVSLCLLLLPQAVQAATYYVDATKGNDANPGTLGAPFKTIQRAANIVVAGDTCLVRAGTYNEQVIIKNSGALDKYITFQAYPGESVTVNGSGKNFYWSGLFDTNGKSYLKISGFRIVNSAYAGIMVVSTGAPWTHIIIEKNYIANTISSGIQVWGPGSNLIVDGNELYQVNWDFERRSLQESLTVADGVDTFEIKNNTINYSTKEGIDAKQGTSNGKIHHNRVSNTASVAIYLDAWDRIDKNIEIFSNVVHDCDDNGIVLAGEIGGVTDNVKIYGNIVYNNGAHGIAINQYLTGKVSNVEVYNNTCYNNRIGIGFGYGDYPIEGLSIKNNIVANNSDNQIGMSTKGGANNLVIDHNLIYGAKNKGGWLRDEPGTNFIESDPQFVNAGNADFHLKSTSPAIDAGVDVGLTFDFEGNPVPQGKAPDIGAYEYGTKTFRYGDVSSDGAISAYDAALTAQYSVDLITLTPEQIRAAEVSGDGEVSAYDAALIAQRAVGLINKFPVE